MSTVSDAVVVDDPMPGVRVLTLNQPQIRNAMTEQLTTAWNAAIADVSADRSVRALVVTGAGTSFCSGADLSWLDQASSQDVTVDRLRDKMVSFYNAWLAPRFLSIPVVAAVNGPAIGAGVCLALACDLRVASRTARFSTPFVHLGTHGGMAVTHLLPEAIGIPRAREMLYTGREVSAEEAADWSLVNAVADDAVSEAVELATRIASAAPVAIRLTKAGLQTAAAGVHASLAWESLAQPVTLTTRDLHEGVAAQRAHRRPRFLDE